MELIKILNKQGGLVKIISLRAPDYVSEEDVVR